eukprot:9484448-Pyramimonas_sp.AAC.1
MAMCRCVRMASSELTRQRVYTEKRTSEYAAQCLGPWNRGLRLDYFVASDCMFPGSDKPCEGVAVHDAWVMHDEVGTYGDHCPVALVLST